MSDIESLIGRYEELVGHIEGGWDQTQVLLVKTELDLEADRLAAGFSKKVRKAYESHSHEDNEPPPPSKPVAGWPIVDRGVLIHNIDQAVEMLRRVL